MKLPKNQYDTILLSDIDIQYQNTTLGEIILHDHHNPSKFIYDDKLETYLYNLLKKYIDNPLFKFLLYDKIECDNLLINARFNLFLNWIKSVGIGDRFFVSSAYNNFKCDFNFKYQPFFLGWSDGSNLNLEQRTFEKNFLFLNRAPRKHRRLFYDFFKENKLLDKSHWTFGSHDNYNPYVWDSSNYPIKNFNNNQPIEVSDMHKLVDEHKSSFISIVTETFFFKDDDEIDAPWADGTQEIPTFVTEKTEKCFSALHPFVIISTPYFLKHLKELGFKTFDKWWDESYDTEEDDNIRVDKLKKLILEISKWDSYKCEKVFNEMKDVLIWNQNKNYEYFLENSKLTSFEPTIDNITII